MGVTPDRPSRKSQDRHLSRATNAEEASHLKSYRGQESEHEHSGGQSKCKGPEVKTAPVSEEQKEG